MKDHERTMQTLRLAALYILGATILYFGLGCGSSPAAPRAPTEKESFVIERAAFYAERLGLEFEVEVVFHDERRDGYDAWAWPSSVHFFRGFVEATDRASLSLTVAHEVCHVAGFGDDAEASCAWGIV